MSKELTTADRARICMYIMERLTSKLEEFYDLYEKFSTTYEEEVTATGISVLAIVNALPTPEVDGLITVGTPAGVLNALCSLFDNCVEQLGTSREILADMLVHGFEEEGSDE